MIKRIGISLIVAVAVLAGTVWPAAAFSLAGPDEEWQTLRLGYTDDAVWPGAMNLTEEYRWNVPLVTYAFTPKFFDFFGERGVAEVEKAIEEFSKLPAYYKLDPNDFPLNTLRVNYRAQEIGLVDIKSQIMSWMLNQYGLADPTFFVNTLRRRWIETDPDPDITNYLVIKRNFDPITHLPTPYINGTLYTYTSILDGDDESQVVNNPVDPLAFGAPVASFFSGVGTFWTGFTRDDIGGLRYIYNPTNLNIEVTQPNTSAASLFGGGGGSGSATQPGIGGGDSPWIPVFIPTTNQPGQTNVTGTNQLAATNFVSAALRAGIDKLNFQRVFYDSDLGFFRPVIHNYTDRYITNNRTVSQRLLRNLDTVPDLLFDAGDTLGGGEEDLTSADSLGRSTDYDGSFTNTAGLNDTGAGGSDFNLGPGIITGPRVFTFNTAGRVLYNSRPPPLLSEAEASEIFVLWGSFDGTTNPPVVYPYGVSVDEVEFLLGP